MNRGSSSNLQYFVAVGFFLVAWWYAPGEVGGHGMSYVMAALFALAGFGVMIEAVRNAVPKPSPFQSRTGRILWALRPRAWLVSWAAIAVAITLFGSPHLLWRYPADGRMGVCEYVGAHGVKRVMSEGGDRFGGCSIVAVLP